MKETVDLTGMVLKAAPVGDSDRRLVILTRERGKITAFARGARRPGSQLMAAARPFVFGTFRLFEGRDAYNLHGAEITNYFTGLAADVEAACYGSYFLEFADYYGREGLDGTELLLLLYQSLRALLAPALPNRLVKTVFELKCMVIGGEYTEHPPRPVCDSANYAWEFVLAASMKNLYTFVLTEEALRDLSACVELLKSRFIDREFHSLKVLETMTERLE